MNEHHPVYAMLRELVEEVERCGLVGFSLEDKEHPLCVKIDKVYETVGDLLIDMDGMRKERDDALLMRGRIMNEIDCRIEHGAESNGHLEAIRNLFKQTKTSWRNREAADEIERLRKERDEARRLFCEDRFNNGKHYRPVGEDLVICASPKEIAEDLGWDCFKEENANGEQK